MTDPLLGRQLNNYRIERIIGHGGMATVYYGWDTSLERPVAIKVVSERFRNNPAYTQRFVQEARTVATWRHDNILQVFYASQEEDGLSYFVMEYVDGPDVGQIMRQYTDDGELMPPEDVLRLGKAIAAALDYAHERQIIHRDVKPSNVMIAKDGRIVLADFGLALNIQQGSIGEIFGTPHYIAPEQARNSATAVPQSDLYALGVILYEMLTGVVPFDDPSPTSLALQHITQPPPNPREINPRLNEAVEVVLLKVLSKQPADRYQTGTQLLTTLTDALQQPDSIVADSDLPPLPTGISAPVMSQKSLAERVSFFLPLPPSAALATDSGNVPLQPQPVVPAPTPTPAHASKKQPWGFIALGVIVVLLLLFLGGRRLLNNDEVVAEEPITASTTRETVLIVPTSIDEPETAEPAAPTEDAIVSDIPATNPPSNDTATPTVAPTQPAVDTPTPIIEPAQQPTANSQPEAVATILYPNGRRLELLYSPNSFYVFNASSNPIRVSSLQFEALNEDGQSIGYSFNGYRWSQFYSFISRNGCVRLEISKTSNYLRPSKCRQYNSTITPPAGDPEQFWSEQFGATQFRILWEDQEVARCPVPADFCEVYIP